ncbi:hypothetical protein SLEP1_g9432 [Rubroshorea leprosula]|uniref:Uncharacterized protein n=1 Tax=Rubroshorea leprosula TaxID=152421 RepID=A0AAV5IAK3_9ROSI|nr:hypothetical protein SLEP1_g9432 [Rubroshorea leprosula]
MESTKKKKEEGTARDYWLEIWENVFQKLGPNTPCSTGLDLGE